MKLVVLFALGLAVAACDARPVRTAATSSSDVKQPVGRFSLFTSSTRTLDGKEIPVVFRIDSTTGESWVFTADPNRWVGVEDELQRAGKYNAQTKKIEWGVKIPDGRDLNDLSKEELVRYLSAAIRNGQSPNPQDPLGLFDPPKK